MQVVQKVNMKISSILSESPIEKVTIEQHNIYVKRDDLLNPYFSGNKARKFAYYLQHNVNHVTKIVSYGSIQANSLYSLAALAQLKGWQLNYYVNRIPAWLKNSTIGNYGQAIALGANIIEVEDNLTAKANNNAYNLDHYMHDMAKTLPANSLFIPEGGRSEYACIGVYKLAQEIFDYCTLHKFFEQHTHIHIMLPSGTGTTALFLQTWFSTHNIPVKVLTCVCVGDENYLKQQFYQLNTDSTQWPTILPQRKKFHFGKLNKDLFMMWERLYVKTGIEFELLYDPVGWQCLLDHLAKNINNSTATFYIHQGGIVGNQTMLSRYKRKYPTLF